MNEIQEVWIVEGSTGEYSDHCEWCVCFFETEKEARQKVDFLSARYVEACAKFPQDSWTAREKQIEAMRVFDPHCDIDYTGTNYRTYSVERGTND